MRWIIALLIAVAAWWFITMPGPNPYDRLTGRNTSLGLFDNRISNVPTEIIRRDEVVRWTWLKFQQECGPRSCNVQDILEIRDARIKEIWPEIFDRLTVSRDWGEHADSRHAHERFFKAISERETSALRNKCVPKIEYKRSPLGDFTYHLSGYACKD